MTHNQNTLRADLTKEVERYLGHADDVHNDYISVDEKTYAVDFRSRHDDLRKPGLEYYNVLDLIKRDGLWFCPDAEAIEAVVQTHLPGRDIKEKYDEWVERIKAFLIAEEPASMHSCRLCIGTTTLSLDCYDESKAPVDTDESIDINGLIDDCESADVVPMRGIVRTTSTGYIISSYRLTKLILRYIQPD